MSASRSVRASQRRRQVVVVFVSRTSWPRVSGMAQQGGVSSVLWFFCISDPTINMELHQPCCVWGNPLVEPITANLFNVRGAVAGILHASCCEHQVLQSLILCAPATGRQYREYQCYYVCRRHDGGKHGGLMATWADQFCPRHVARRASRAIQ